MAARTELEELDIAQQILGAVFTSTPDALVVLDKSLTILQANPAFCTWVGRALVDVTGQFIADIFASNQFVPAMHQLAHTTLSSTSFELTVDTPVKRSLLAHVARLQAGRLGGWIVTLHDLSERRRLEYQKMEFINIAAHELRTPLMAVIGFSNLLNRGLGGQLDERHQEFLLSIVDGGQQLKGIIDELLQFANLDRGHLEEAPKEYGRLHLLIESIIGELQQRVAEKHIRMHVDIDPTIVLSAGSHLLRTAINQLVVNAINFNHPNGSVDVLGRRNGEDIVVDVIDTGIGIANVDLEMIFQPFCQVEDHYIRQVGGLGLGLSIAKRAATQLGGTITVASEIGRGSTFTFCFPIQPAPNDEMATLQEQLHATRQQTQVYARDIQSLYSQLQTHSMETLASITGALEARDAHFRNHTERVTQLALQLARKLGYPDWYISMLEMACRIYDIGKIGVPDAIINKMGLLTPEEETIMRQHVAMGRRIVEPLTFLKDALPIAFSHHERWDGQGYPDGLSGEEIPIGGRIIAVADAYDALVSARSYREALSHAEAVTILAAGAGNQWDPTIVMLLLEIINAESDQAEQSSA